MATETLQVRLLMENSQYKRQAREASTATGQIAGQAQTATTQTSKLDRQLGATGITMRTAIAGGAVVAGAAVGAFVKDSIRAASDLQESVNAVNVVFGDAADGIHALGEESVDSFGMSTSSFNEFAVRFSAFAEQIAGEGGDVVGVVDDMSTRVADFASVHNLSLEEAARVAQSTLAGETEVFRRFGGDVSAATVKAHAFETGIADVGSELTEQQKILSRYSLFMEQTGDTAGDFANTQDDLANAMRSFQGDLENAQAEIGEALLPVMAELVNVGRDLIPVFTSVAKELVGVTENAAPLIDALTFVNGLIGDTGDAAEDGAESTSILGAAFDGLLNFMNPIKKPYDAIKETMEDGDEAARDGAEGFSILGGEMNQIPTVMEGAEDAIHDLNPEMRALFGAAGDVADAQEDLERETSDATRALEEQFNLLRAQIDPLFALQDAANRVAEAQQAIADAETPEDQRRAISDLAEANLDLRGAQVDVISAGGRTREEFIKQQVELGLTREQAELLADDFETLEGFEFTPKEISITTRVSGPGSRNVGSFFGSAGERQHGGPVSAGRPYVVGEVGPELFIPDRSGTVVANNQMTSTGSTPIGQSGPTFVFYGDVYGDEGFRQRVREANVQNGRLGLN